MVNLAFLRKDMYGPVIQMMRCIVHTKVTHSTVDCNTRHVQRKPLQVRTAARLLVLTFATVHDLT